MNTEKFTQGEWRVKAHPHPWDKSVNDVFYEIQWSEDGELVADIIYKKEDAVLMAASKEMYALLKMIADPATFMGSLTNEYLRIAIESVLKKARGEE